MKLCKPRPAFHIAMPAPGLILHDSRSGASSPCTPLPHTPMPFEEGDFMHRGRALGGANGVKRAREDDVESISSWDGFESDDDEWEFEELDVLHSILHNPLRPLSTPYPPSTLPPSEALDELTDQITSIHLGASSLRSFGEWRHSWTLTRGKLFQLALKESKGLTLAPAGDVAKWVRPPIKRVGSMDFLKDAENEDRGRALRLSTSLQNTSTKDPSSVELPSMLLSAPIAIPSMTITPSSLVTVAPQASSSSRRCRPSRAAYTRRPSLLQRGRSFTASDLASDDGHDIEVEATAAAPASVPTTTKRLTRSQSSLFLSHGLNPPNSLTKAFLAPHEPSTADPAELCRPILLEPDDTRKKRRLSPGFQMTVTGTAPVFQMAVDGLSSPFEERPSLDF